MTQPSHPAGRPKPPTAGWLQFLAQAEIDAQLKWRKGRTNDETRERMATAARARQAMLRARWKEAQEGGNDAI
jgi:hypothetical protein